MSGFIHAHTYARFHPSKEGFKASGGSSVSISPARFHPSKEGFKAPRRAIQYFASSCFHPSKEGFKDGDETELGVSCSVSIPLRKVSRLPLPTGVSAMSFSFHPSKEGFKVTRTD